MDRRTLLKRSGLRHGRALASQPFYGAIGKADAAADAAVKSEVKRTVCTNCSVGCVVDATVENGVDAAGAGVRLINLGAHCARGRERARAGMLSTRCASRRR